MANNLTFMFKGPGEIAEALGARARQMRLEQNIGQLELAAQAGLSFGTLRRLERGENVSLENFIRVLDALGRVDDLAQVLVAAPVQSIREAETLAQRPVRRRATPRSS